MDYDIIIVGAGPAGLSTGLHLAQLAPHLAERTLILEREHHPRPKLCAGGVLPGAEVCLRKLGLDLDEVNPVPVQVMDLQFRGISYPVRRKPATFRVVRREEFDAWLADAARQRGLVLQEGVRVQEVVVADSRVQVLTDQGVYQAKVVVGADGSKGVARKSVVQSESSSQMARVLEVKIPAESRMDPNGRALFDFSVISEHIQGYLWDFPSQKAGKSLKVWGVYDSRIYSKAPRGSLKEALRRGMLKHGGPADGYQLEGHPFRWFNRRAEFAAPHILLVGDAAGSDPVVGEGISFALGYGELAAGALRDAFAQNDFSFSDYKQRVLRHRVGRYLSRRVTGAKLLYGFRPHWLLRIIWPLVGWLAETFLIDWRGGE